MIIDIIYGIVLLLAFIYGFSRGLIQSIVSLIAIIIGIMAAVYLSNISAITLDRWFNISSKYLPIISFLVVFLLIYLLFRLAAKGMEGLFKALKLNFINKFAGAIVWVVIWTLLYSTLLFYANNMQLLPLDTKAESVVYEKIEPLAPETIETIGKIIPPVKNIFNSLQQWFMELENKAEKHNSENEP
ncbi:MAG: CvpA family protein [Chitinophagales bacterium]